MWARKAPYHYGWDWGPRFVTSGIWRPVTLEAWDERAPRRRAGLPERARRRRARDAGASTRASSRRAPAGARVTVGARRRAGAGRRPTSTLKPGVNDVDARRRASTKPERWWPNGLGAQQLYTLETSAGRRRRRARDARATRIGLRTLEVVHERDKDGKSFIVKVNGAPVFMKGANWIPADSFVTRVTPSATASCCSRPPTRT